MDYFGSRAGDVNDSPVFNGVFFHFFSGSGSVLFFGCVVQFKFLIKSFIFKKSSNYCFFFESGLFYWGTERFPLGLLPKT